MKGEKQGKKEWEDLVIAQKSKKGMCMPDGTHGHTHTQQYR